MRYFKCAYCGKHGEDKSANRSKRFCCKECSDAYWRRKRGAGLAKEDRRFCKFNEGVECYDHKCRTCGWNPKVQRKRLEKIVGCGR